MNEKYNFTIGRYEVTCNQYYNKEKKKKLYSIHVYRLNPTGRGLIFWTSNAPQIIDTEKKAIDYLEYIRGIVYEHS